MNEQISYNTWGTTEQQRNHETITTKNYKLKLQGEATQGRMYIMDK